jgi:transcriptional regulator with XRE-family HTH domain
MCNTVHMETAVGRTIFELRDRRGWTQEELGKKVGIDRTGIVRRESGATTVSLAEQKKFAKAFGLTIDEFEKKWRSTQVHERPAPLGIPVINKAPAGQVVDYDHSQCAAGEYHDALEYLDRDDLDDSLAFAVEVVGDSMAPWLSSGDRVIFSPVTVPNPRVQLKGGDTVFVRFAPESKVQGCQIARFHPQDDGTVLFAKDNPKYPPVQVPRENISQLAVFVELRTKRQR